MTWHRIVPSLALAAILAGCAGDPAPTPAPGAEPASVVGTDGVELADADPTRIVTLGGPVTEIVYALGLGDRVVGTDASSLHPDEVMEKPRLSYFRRISAEGVLSLDPTLIIALDGMGPPPVVDQLRTAGVPVLLVPETEAIEEAENRIETLGAALDRRAGADSLVAQMQADLAEAAAMRPEQAPKALFVYARGAGVVNVSGSGTAADLVMRLAGAENAVTEFDGFQPLTAEAAAEAAPDVVVIPARGLESLGGADGLFRQPGLAQTPAGQNRRVIAIDDALLLGLGPRVGEGIKRLAGALAEVSAPPAVTAQR
ncbi:MAG: ABC transporter substrate-binding protein [Bacteroidota bacterium]